MDDKKGLKRLLSISDDEFRAEARGELEGGLRRISKNLRALRDGRLHIRYKERYTQFETGLSACTEAYKAYLRESERYQRAKIIQEAYCAPGGIEYRISLLNDYVQEDLDSEDEIRYVMTRGYFECIQPVLTETAAMQERLSAQTGTAPPKEPERDELLRRYFRGKSLYRLVELLDAAGQCQKELLENPNTSENLRAARKRVSELRAEEVSLCRQCENGNCARFLQEIGDVTEELASHSRELALELEHYERLAACIVKCVSALDRDSLFVEKDGTGGYTGDAGRLAELKEAYAQATRKLEEVTEIGRYRAAE